MGKTLRLTELLGNSSESSIADHFNDVEIQGITCDSRQVNKDFLFVALKGSQADGSQFIPMAIEKGAKVILSEPGVQLPAGLTNDVCLLTEQNPRRAFAKLAARFYKQQPAHSVAVTGTNGKTSVAYFFQQLWNMAGQKAASIGTIGISGVEALEKEESLTTPDPVKLHQTLARLAEQYHVDYLSMEASSHGLDQYRLDGVQLQAAGFTNLSRDHLDYHGTMEAYLAAKLRLFSEVLPEGSVAVINKDIPEYQRIEALCQQRHHHVMSYGKTAGATLYLKDIIHAEYGQRVRFFYKEQGYTVLLPLLGEFQVYNALCALGLALATGLPEEQAIPLLGRLKPAPGRMERVSSGTDKYGVFVDYAHTPDAMEKALKELRPYAKGQLWVVFGCGGDRDKGKRPEMGAVASTLADRAVVTDDNPRSEDPAVIRQEILVACPRAKEVGGRKEAIDYAISKLKEGDILLISGKGHEKTQKVGNVVYPFDDVEVASEAMANATF